MAVGANETPSACSPAGTFGLTTPTIFGPVSDSGQIRLPSEDRSEEKFMAGLDTVAELEAEAAKPVTVHLLDASGATLPANP